MDIDSRGIEHLSPCCDEPMVEVDGSNCNECPACHSWYLVIYNQDGLTFYEVI